MDFLELTADRAIIFSMKSILLTERDFCISFLSIPVNSTFSSLQHPDHEKHKISRTVQWASVERVVKRKLVKQGKEFLALIDNQLITITKLNYCRTTLDEGMFRIQ
jgi:hypothetical protein